MAGKIQPVIYMPAFIDIMYRYPIAQRDKVAMEEVKCIIKPKILMYYVIDDEELEANLMLNLHLLGIGHTIEIVKDNIRAETLKGTWKYFPTGLFKITGIRHRILARGFGHMSPGSQVYVYLEQITEPY